MMLRAGVDAPAGPLWFCLIVALASGIAGVDRGNFKTCDQSFCKRHRALEPGQSRYIGVPDTLVVTATGLTLHLLNTENNVRLRLDLTSLDDNSLRLKVNELNPLRPRYETPVGDVLLAEPTTSSLELLSRDSSQVVVKTTTSKIVIGLAPFRIDVLVDDTPVISVNARGLLKFEHLRVKKSPPPAQEGENVEQKEGEGEENKKEEHVEDKEEEGLWDETFKTHHDSKPNGPTSIGLDFSFPGYEHVYGIPEHADSLALKSTKTTDPYRLYNLDVFEYEIGNPMALYGAVPVMHAHNAKQTVGMFWNNAAETWVDIGSNIADKNMFAKLVDFVKRGDEIPQVDTQWISESGVIDVFLFLGPRPVDVCRQYTKITGTTSLPPLFALAYHQSRWNYNDEQDVASVDAGFDEHDIPVDVIWLDIEHTDGKRYFTWDQHRFPNPADMLRNISSKGRKIVAIVDPHIKRDDGYHVYKEAKDLGYFIKTKDGSDFEGWCWPGSSAWPDFTDPKIRDFWASKFLPEAYAGSTNDLFVWNDMNEPSVFSGPEITMVKDAKHFGGWEHRDMHNMYGTYVHRATWEGLELRASEERPFVLSRAFFAGSQRYGAIWTGDNTGEWSHLKITLPMVMSLNLVGITFSGADVGGFFRNPDPELLTRWYQAAAFQPFFRAHAHLDTRRREPWLLPDENHKAIRNALRQRYRMLPYWYTLFFNSEKDGAPVVKPLWVDFPEDRTTFSMEDQHLLGSAVLVHPIVDMGSVGATVYFPGSNEVWYDADTYQSFAGGKGYYMSVDLHKIPVFYRGGYIIPVRERIRRASTLAAENDPYSLIISLNTQGKAAGDLYHDDFHSLQYKKGHYIHRQFTFTDGKLTSTNLHTQPFKSSSWIERIVIVGVQSKPARIQISVAGGSTQNLDMTYDSAKKLLVIRKPGVAITSDFVISLN